MDCPDCKGMGKTIADRATSKAHEVNCFRCDGTGELCDHCGESVAVCEGYCNLADAEE